MMKDICIYGTFSSVFFRECDKRIFLTIEIYDVIMEMMQYIPADITDELAGMYKDIVLDKNFVKSIEEKIKTTIAKDVITMKYSEEKEWKLGKTVKELFF